jgi:hypothetical protein
MFRESWITNPEVSYPDRLVDGYALSLLANSMIVFQLMPWQLLALP